MPVKRGSRTCFVNRLGIICPADFYRKFPPGGALGLVEAILQELPYPATIFGIGIDGTAPWIEKKIAPLVSFIPIAKFKFPSLIPMRLKCLFGYLLYRKRILRSGIDVLYVHAPECALPFMFFNADIPVVYHQHGSFNPLTRAVHFWARIKLLQMLFDSILHCIHKRADSIIAIDKLCAEQAVRNGATGQVTVINNAVDLSEFRPDSRTRASARAELGCPPDCVAILFVGRIEELKRVDLLIRSLPHLDLGAPLHLFVAGDGSHKERCMEISGMEAPGRVTFLGHLPHHELPRLYNMADITVLPSELEGVPMVLLESLACGTPVVAFRTGGVPDIIDPAIHGELIDEAAPQALAAAISRVAGRTFDRSELASSVAIHGSGQVVGQLTEIFDRVSASRLERP